MKYVDLKSSTYIDFNKENYKEASKVKVGDHVRISKCKNIFAKHYVQNWKKFLWLKRLKILYHVINDFNSEKAVATFYENELQKTDQNEFRVEDVIKRKGNELYVKWKGYDNFLAIEFIKKT